MSANYKIRDVEVNIEDGIGIDDALANMVRDYVDNRFKRPIIAYLAKDKSTAMRFASPTEEKKYDFTTPHKDIRLHDCEGRIYVLGGLKVNNLTTEDIACAERRWYEPDYAEKGQDDKPWIDD